MLAATLDAPVATSSLLDGGGAGLIIAKRPQSSPSTTENEEEEDGGPIDLTMGKIGGGGGSSMGVLDLTIGKLGLGGGEGGGDLGGLSGDGLGLLNLGILRGEAAKSGSDHLKTDISRRHNLQEATAGQILATQVSTNAQF